jgi:membrane-associated phospholipid phosphatase/predicted protein tyrosine phosphatase
MSASQPSKVSAAATALGLSLLFMVVYGGSNWITAHRDDIDTWYYGWERYIPFVPLLIVPYMSIDLFFVAAPFLCSTRPELRTLARRIAFAILFAGACFLLIPLTTAVPRPQPAGWTGALFRFLHGFDQPYNLFPSLHIALRTILAALYARHTRGVVRTASHVWFSLIGISTLLTYQHHFVDIVGGFILAAICFYLFREEDTRLPVVPNARVGWYYAAGALAAMGAAWTAWPWTGILLWPAAALALTAAGYWGLGPGIYRKTGGRLPLSTRLLFAPILIGQHLSLLHYRRYCAAWNEVTPHVWISARLNRREAAAARRSGVTAVLDLTAEFTEHAELRALTYHNLPILDLTAPTSEQLREAVDFVSRNAGPGVLCAHCKVGYSRSAAVVGAYLLASGKVADADEAVALLQRARPGIVIRPEAREALKRFEQEHLACNSNASVCSTPHVHN